MGGGPHRALPGHREGNDRLRPRCPRHSRHSGHARRQARERDNPDRPGGVDDPVALGVVDSLEHPGGNATGLSLTSSELIADRLQLLRELVPGLRRLAVIVRQDPGLEQRLQDIRNHAERMGFQLLMLAATTGRALELAFARLSVEGCEAVYVASGPLGPAKRERIISLAAEARLPAIYSFRAFPVDGGLISFAADHGDLYRRAAGYADKILRGADPADLPVEPPRNSI